MKTTKTDQPAVSAPEQRAQRGTSDNRWRWWTEFVASLLAMLAVLLESLTNLEKLWAFAHTRALLLLAFVGVLFVATTGWTAYLRRRHREEDHLLAEIQNIYGEALKRSFLNPTRGTPTHE
jgi:hypothetical protein